MDLSLNCFEYFTAKVEGIFFIVRL